MLPAVALVGRPNVGKSTLFNRLTRSRDALVADEPGVTRDRRYGFASHDGARYVVIDTGGLGGIGEAEIDPGVERQVAYALDEADALVLVVDQQAGLSAGDLAIADRLRRSGKAVTVAINKSEGLAPELAAADFHGLGLGEPVAIAARHGHGVPALIERVLAPFDLDAAPEAAADERARLAVIGRPNVGKSTLINRLVGEDRLVTSPAPGTTRDSIVVPCEREGYRFLLIDTAGIRRRSRVDAGVEKFSVVQSLKAIDDAGVVIVLLDAREGVTDQDLHLIGMAADRGRALVIGINKWDGMEAAARRRVESEVDRQLEFVAYADRRYISALHGSGIAELVESAMQAYQSAGREIPTPRLNELLTLATTAHPPPVVRGRRIRLRYAHQGGRYPPLIVIHGSQAERVPARYRRYLENSFRKALKLVGTPVRIEFRSGDNPFAGRRNRLTQRQERRRQRVIRHNR
ncbi:MAG TPA: ribosome biogenesis GTPase Der [Gammaproteobacteria bacterium]|nr:ribosome biogenesis GTPase Der [Gammaproteobacteria bacterium]